MSSLSEMMKRRLAKSSMRGQISPEWPEGYPKRLEPKACTYPGYIETRVIYRRVINTSEKEKVSAFYVSDKAAYFYLDFDDKQYSWHVLSFDEYFKEYSMIFDTLRTKGLIRTAFKSSEIELFDEVTKIVSLKLIMELDPSPEEIDNLETGNMALIESEHELKMQRDQDFLDSIV